MSNRLLVSTRKGLFVVERTGGQPRWAVTGTAFLGDNVTLALPDSRNGSVLAAIDHGHFGVKIQRSTDGGAGWEECEAPAYPAAGKKEDEPASLKLIWALETGGADEDGVIWAGTIPGALFRSEDNGTTWRMVDSLWNHPKRKEWFGGGAIHPGIHSVCVDPRDSRRVTVGVSCGGVWVTKDAGKSWECKADGMWASFMPEERKHDPNVQDPHHVVQCPANPDVLWAQHHNGVFKTVDGCESWLEIKAVKPSVFGFAVAVHPADPETAWFVPAVKDQNRTPVDGKVVVARTRDGGKSFEVLRKGLPQENAYDLTYRHGLDIDETGDRLAFGSTTGSLWVSEDQGDSWETVSNHLPPVYAVRFWR